jgi:CelD/BcsL family acetyltransferase involved in cellulose biosynthesis
MESVAASTALRIQAIKARTALSTHALEGIAPLDAALAAGFHKEWAQLVSRDPRASVYQSPGWCVPWYRCYQDEYDPHVLALRDGAVLAGVLPMAVEKSSGRLVFASDAMADYRDIVALPAYRRAVVAALIDHFRHGEFAGALSIGWLDPASDTPALVDDICREAGLRSIARYQPCYRWFPEPGENLNKKFSRVRTHLNHFKRQGSASFEIVDNAAAWRTFFADFIRQHSLRQLQAAREVSFDDPRKQAFYDLLFAGGTLHLHVSAFRVNGRVAAGHVGLVWRDVLMLGAPSISLEDEQRSPAVILMTWIIQNAQQLGLAGLDLTIGESEFKRRLGNRCVQLTMVEIYRGSRDYYTQRARSTAARVTRLAADRLLGDGAWERSVKPAAEAAQYKWQRARELGARASLVKAASAVAGRSASALVYETAGLDGAAVERLPGAEVHANTLDDLLLWSGRSPSSLAAVRGCARAFARNRAAGHTLHTLVANGRLEAWCYAGADTVYDVYVLPDADAGACEALIGAVTADRLAAGARNVRVALLESARAIRGTLAAMGFRIAPTES